MPAHGEHAAASNAEPSSSTKSVVRRVRQITQLFALDPEGCGVAPIAPHDDLAHEALVGCPVVEIAVPTQQQRLVDRVLEEPVRRLDAAVLVAHAAVVARARHVVVVQQRRVPHGEVLFLGQILERRRQAVSAMLLRGAASLPQGVLQALGQSHEALAAFNHLDMLPAGEGQHEVVQDVRRTAAPAIVMHNLPMAVKSDRPRWPGAYGLAGRTLPWAVPPGPATVVRAAAAYAARRRQSRSG
jgi:hypothetical protein